MLFVYCGASRNTQHSDVRHWANDTLRMIVQLSEFSSVLAIVGRFADKNISRLAILNVTHSVKESQRPGLREWRFLKFFNSLFIRLRWIDGKAECAAFPKLGGSRVSVGFEGFPSGNCTSEFNRG